MTTHRSTNRPVTDWLTAEEACERLGVKRQTLYTYASRGRLRTRSAGRRKHYHAGDVERLRSRAAAHGGHAARAAEALAWGEPVLDTTVSAIDADGPYYDGVCALDLVDTPIRTVAERMWNVSGPWPEVDVPKACDLLDLRRIVDTLARNDPERSRQVDEHERAKLLHAAIAQAAALPDHPHINAAQVLVIDHGLNASTFTGRVIASTGADLYACISGALAALSGPRHGTVVLGVQELLNAYERHGPTALRDRFSRSGGLPGFGHPLYPAGDPRAEVLLANADDALIDELCAVVAPWGLRPNLDVGLLALTRDLALPVEAASMIFAVGRSIGWIAHVFEQRQRPGLLRPRAAYTWVS